MIVSWNWLTDYVDLGMSVEELTDRLTMSGLNLEGIETPAGDTAIDLEVTSNRPDCLGHLGVAREIAVLYDRELKIPEAQVAAGGEAVSAATSVEIECEDLCPRYHARVIKGVKIGPSPAWLQARLEAVGVATVNNVVDVTNYVLLECGQPLHAFDFDKLHGQRIVVRRAQAGEKIVAIDQKEYALDTEMCVIADADRPVAIGGVMGGLETEIGDGTVNVLIETAQFASMSIRQTARKLNLHSPSSYRFERTIDADQMDWASRRCCELILQTAGGELLDGSVAAGATELPVREPITLRFGQVGRILGVDVPPEESASILTSLGLEQVGAIENDQAQFTAPSWRRDLTREADLIEEIARIYGYDKIPDDVAVPLQLSSRTHRDRVSARVRDTLCAAGFFEAITLSFVSAEQAGLFMPRGDSPLLSVEHSSRRQENVLRQSLIPSLLQVRRENERHGTFDTRLFEIAHVYLKSAPGEAEAETEPVSVGLVTGLPFAELKGVVEGLARRMDGNAVVSAAECKLPQFVRGRAAELSIAGCCWGWIGELERSVTDPFDLKDAVTVAELDLALLEEVADLLPAFAPLPQFPAIHRDMNFLLDETTTWSQLETVVWDVQALHLERVSFGGQYRGKQIPADKKSYVVTADFRAADRTLTSEEIDAAQAAIVEACELHLGATLR
jgi:phenylalanyl-tRNA synthetase beta chain